MSASGKAGLRSLFLLNFLFRRSGSGNPQTDLPRASNNAVPPDTKDALPIRLPPLSPDVVMAMADNLRAPLVGITSILDQSLGNGSDPDSGLALARHEATRLLELVSGLTDYARIRDGAAVFHAEHFNLASTVESVTGALSHIAAGKNIAIEVAVPIIEMRNDLKTMHQVLFSCLHCALLSAGVRQVRIRAESDVHLVKLSMRYDGEILASHKPGWVAPGQAQETGPVTLPSAETGSLVGIELNLAAWFCAALGGSLHVEREDNQNVISLDLPRSMSFGQRATSQGLPAPVKQPPAPRHTSGTALQDTIPPAGLDAKPDSKPDSKPDPSLDTSPDPSPDPSPDSSTTSIKGRVLIIDDEPVSLFALKRRMESAGWLVHAMVSVMEAIALVEAGEVYTVIIVDSRMPEMSGFDFCNRIRAKFGKEVLPVLLMLDSGHSSVIDRAFRSGANDYLIRPVGGIELEARIKTHVDLAASLRRELDHRARMAESDKYRTLAMLTAGVAHEINTPNNATLRNIPILREIWLELGEALGRLYQTEGGFNVRGYDYEDLRRELPAMLDDVYMGAQHIRKIVTDLKDYARGPSRLEACVEPADVNQSISYAFRLLKHTIALGTNHFIQDLATNLPPVRADRLKLTQVIVNILENALQSLPSPAAAVRLQSFVEQDPGSGTTSWVCILVSDEGRGMDSQTLASVFDPFFTTKRERGGTGLGMPVALGIVRELGGNIELRSTIGLGTSVLVRIPSCLDTVGGHHDT